MEPPTPVVFKSLGIASTGDETVSSLKLIHFKIDYRKPNVGNGYYLLSSYSDPAHPLRLYPSAMDKLFRQLEFAFSEAKRLEEQQQPLEDNDHYDCGLINSYGTMNVRLVLSTFRGHVNIWLRLYTLGEENAILPTKTGVRFSQEEDVDAIASFITENKKSK